MNSNLNNFSDELHLEDDRGLLKRSNNVETKSEDDVLLPIIEFISIESNDLNSDSLQIRRKNNLNQSNTVNEINNVYPEGTPEALNQNRTTEKDIGNIQADSELITRYFASLSLDNFNLENVITTSVRTQLSGEQIYTQDAESTALIGLDVFRADNRFKGIDGTGFNVVILDTGIDLDHPFFGDRIVYSYDFADGDANASDYTGHGSNVSSIIGGHGSYTYDGVKWYEYSGIAPNVNIIHLKVFGDNGEGNFGYIEQALQWVEKNVSTYNIASVNMSLGDGNNFNTPQTQYGIADELYRLATQHQVIVAAAAGNHFWKFNGIEGVSYPAADPYTIGVGAVFDSQYYDSNIRYPWYSGASFNNAVAYSVVADQITPFSQRHIKEAATVGEILKNSLTEIFAPGAPILGATHNGGLGYMVGTSQATPQIAGVVVLAQQLAQQQLGRRLTFNEIEKLLYTTGVTIRDGDDENDNVTNTGKSYKRVDMTALGNAVLSMANVPSPEPTTVEFAQTSYKVNENSGNALITLNRTGDLSQSSIINLSYTNQTTSNNDYTANPLSVSFAAGEATKTITVPIMDDRVYESDEIFNITLTNPSHGTLLGTHQSTAVTIVNDDPLSYIGFDQSYYLDEEDKGTIRIFLTRFGNLYQSASADFVYINQTASNLDYTPSLLNVTFNVYENIKALDIPIIDDKLIEDHETFYIRLASPSYGSLISTQNQALIKIIDNDSSIEFAYTDYQVSEQGGHVTISLNRSGNYSYQSSSVDVVFSNQTATELDYTPKPLRVTFMPYETLKTLSIPIINDQLFEGDETFVVSLANPSHNALIGPKNKTTVTIVDDDITSLVEFGKTSYSINENEKSALITLNRSGYLGQASEISLSYANGSANKDDYTPNAYSVHFEANETTKTVSVPITNDDITEANETFNITLNNPSKGTALGTQNKTTVTIVDNDTIIGEVGRISNLDHNFQTIKLQQFYHNPVVFVMPPSYEDVDMGVVRVANVQSNQFTTFFQEASYLDTLHKPETVSYVVFEAGVWQLDNGAILEVGLTNTNAMAGTGIRNNFSNVSFSTNFSNTPVVLSQIQTYSDTAPQDTFTLEKGALAGKSRVDIAMTRQQNLNNKGFQLALQEEEARLPSGHTTETVGWFAIESGSGTWNGNPYQAGTMMSDDSFSSQNFEGNRFNKTPYLLAGMATFNGSDSSGLRYQNLTAKSVQLAVQEDKSLDDETKHAKENIGFLALAGNQLLTGTQLNGMAGISSVGINVNAVDYLVATNKADTLVLGSATEIYYDNNRAKDYAVIQGFEQNKDVIQLKGKASDYRLETLSDGIAIFLLKQDEDELLGIVEDNTLSGHSFNLTSKNFAYV